MTRLVSGVNGSATVTGNADSGSYGYSLVISRDGQFIAFFSLATNLVSGQSGAAGNVFLYNAKSSRLTLLSGVSGSATVGAGGVFNLAYFLVNGIPDPITSDSTQVLSISDDGSLVAYVSQASNIVSGQIGPAATENVFLYRNTIGQTTLVTGVNGSATATGNYESGFPALSGDGSVLALHSLASNLKSGVFDGNGLSDVFTFTPPTPSITLVSRAAFRAPPAPGNSFSTSVSADGRYTVFTSTATNLVSNQVTANQNQNIFLYDKQTGIVTLVNHAPDVANTTGNGGLGFARQPNARPPSYLQPVISADGHFVAFASFDLNLVPNENFSSVLSTKLFFPHVYLYNVQTGQITLISHAPGAPTTVALPAGNPVINADGSYIAYVYGFPGDDNFRPGQQGTAVLYNRSTDTSTYITPLPPGIEGGGASNPLIDDSGRYVAYVGPAVYLFDRNTGNSALVGPIDISSLKTANSTAYAPVLSHDGMYIAFVSAAPNLVSGQTASSFTNVFLYTVSSGTVSLVSGANGSARVTGNGNSDSPAIASDGSYVAYRSDATNLVTGQSGTGSNIFEFNRLTASQTLVSHQVGSSTTAVGGCSQPVIDGDGHLISYVSTAGNLIPGQSGAAGVKNVYIWLRQKNANILTSGQNGSATVTGNADSDGPLLTRNSFPGFSSTATNLVPGVGGKSAAYINTLVAVALSPNTVADSSATGTVIGTLSITSLLLGQYEKPTYQLPLGVADNGTAAQPNFLLTGADGNTLVLNVQPQYPSKPSYVVRVLVQHTGLEDASIDLTVTVAAPVATHFSIQAGPSVRAGTPFSVTVTALDRYNNPVPGYSGTVQFSSSDPGATLPANYTFTAADKGVHLFSSGILLTGSPSQTLTVSDVATPSLTASATITVTAASPHHLRFGQQPTSTAAGSMISPAVTVLALDAYGNLVSGDTSDLITIALGTNPAGGNLTGTLTVTVQNGVATFRTLAVSREGSGYTLLATAGGLAGAISAAFSVTAEEIRGTVFHDANTNGVQDAGEPGLAGQTVFVDLDGSGVWQAADPSAVTDTDGSYHVGVPGAGHYTVRQILLGGVLLRVPVGGSYQVTVTGGQNPSGQDFADVPTSIAVPLTLPPTTPFPAQGTATADYVEAVYRAVLDRDADAGGLAHWSGLLDSGLLSRLQVVQGIRNSQEHFTQEVTQFYRTLLRRAPDAAGLQGWVDHLASGMPEEQMAYYFLDSPEYLSKGDKHFVDAMYESLLGRSFDAAGEAGWLEQLGDDGAGTPTHAARLTHEQVIRDFLYAPESLTRLTEGYYEVFLQRPADPGGLSNWVAQLQQGLSFLTIGQEFLASDEFFHRAAQQH